MGDQRNLILNFKLERTWYQRLAGAILLVIGWCIALFLFQSVSMPFGEYVISLFHGVPSAHLEKVDKVWRYIFFNYGPFILAIWAVFFLWAASNKLRFSGRRDQRRSGKHYVVTEEESAKHYTLPVQNVRQAMKSKVLLANFSESGALLDLGAKSPYFGAPVRGVWALKRRKKGGESKDRRVLGKVVG